MPPDGYVDDDLRASDIVEDYRDGMAEGVWPEHVMRLCNWGCAIWSHVDCSSPLGPVLTNDDMHDDDGGMTIDYRLTSPSLSAWLWNWVSGASLFDDMYEVIGERVVMNPFTRQAMKRPIKRLKGTVVYTTRLPR